MWRFGSAKGQGLAGSKVAPLSSPTKLNISTQPPGPPSPKAAPKKKKKGLVRRRHSDSSSQGSAGTITVEDPRAASSPHKKGMPPSPRALYDDDDVPCGSKDAIHRSPKVTTKKPPLRHAKSLGTMSIMQRALLHVEDEEEEKKKAAAQPLAEPKPQTVTSESKLAWPTTPPSPALASTLTRRTGGGNEGSAALSSTLTRRTGGDNDGPAALSSTLTRQRPEAPQASEPALPTPPAVAPNPFIPPPLMA